MQAFEPRLSALLSARWPGLVADVLGHDEDRGWLLLADAGTPVGDLGNPPEAWLEALPSYAELQRGECGRAADHERHGVPDLRLAVLPQRLEQLIRHPLPLGDEETARLRGLPDTFGRLCAELAERGVPETVQHDDLHMANTGFEGSSQHRLGMRCSAVRFSESMVPEIHQGFWQVLADGGFITDAAVAVGTYRSKGRKWLRAAGGVRPRRGRDLQGRYLSFSERGGDRVGPGSGRVDADDRQAVGPQPVDDLA
ncbi:MAG TPA: hypothetical protein VFJ19_17120 [Nocardioidaceae bacterium]|nr:hypothetical protein [Nocardioidaceae bacterium]